MELDIYKLLVTAVAVYYIASCIVDFAKTTRYKLTGIPRGYYIGRLGHDGTAEYPYSLYFLDFKPFNCQLCMSGWVTIAVYAFNVPYYILVVACVAGIATMLWKIAMRLETFVS